MSSFQEYGDYLIRRWDELGGEAATQAVRQRTGIFKEDQMPWGVDQTRAEALAEEFKAAQCPIFVRIAGELFHQQGHKDVGLGSKPGGNNWQTPNGPVASDIIVLKSLDGDGTFQWVDCFSSMGGPQAKPQWAVIEPNTDRAWLQPPPPGATPDPGPKPPNIHLPEDAMTESQVKAMIAAAVAPLQAQIATLKQNALTYGASVALRAANGQVLCAQNGGPKDANEAFEIQSRSSIGAWESYRLERGNS